MILVTPLEPVAPMVLDMPIEAGMLVMVLLAVLRETRLMKYVPANMLLHRGEPIGLCSLMRLLCLARWNLLYFSSIYLLCPYYSGPGTSSSCLLEKPETSTRFDATEKVSKGRVGIASVLAVIGVQLRELVLERGEDELVGGGHGGLVVHEEGQGRRAVEQVSEHDEGRRGGQVSEAYKVNRVLVAVLTSAPTTAKSPSCSSMN
nr:hypothetical protein CFP56_76279 [Quercus suber]